MVLDESNGYIHLTAEYKFKILSLKSIEEGRAASKSPHSKFGYILSISQQAVSADTHIRNNASLQPDPSPPLPAPRVLTEPVLW
jgi:hypothetical protein